MPRGVYVRTKPVSDETRAKISAAKMGHSVSETTRGEMSSAQMGRKHTPEARAKMAAAKLGNSYGAGHGPISHGMHGTLTYSSWRAMKQRCNTPTNNRYEDYGGRGITYCREWQTFEGFFASMGIRPGSKREYSIDRIDPDGNYEPANCRWATASEQERNKRK